MLEVGVLVTKTGVVLRSGEPGSCRANVVEERRNVFLRRDCVKLPPGLVHLKSVKSETIQQ
jgi:hypothetical protein